MKNVIVLIIGVLMGFAICWFCCRPEQDYSLHWNPEKYTKYNCDEYFNKFYGDIANPKSPLAGVKIQKSNLVELVDSCSSGTDVYLALVLDLTGAKTLLVAGTPNPNPTGAGINWNTTPGSGSNSNIQRSTSQSSKDTIWYVSPDARGSQMGYIINQNNKWVSYDAATHSRSNIFLNKMMKSILPGDDAFAGPVQGCPTTCAAIIGANIAPK